MAEVFQLASYVRDIASQATAIDPKDFAAQLVQLPLLRGANGSPVVESYVREGKGYIRFPYGNMKQTISVSISTAAMGTIPATIVADPNPSTLLNHALNNLVLRTGEPLSEKGTRWIGFGIKGEGTLKRGEFNLAAFAQNIGVAGAVAAQVTS